MSQQNQNQEKDTIVYCVVRYGQLIGCYSDYEDACQVQRGSIAKGQICDLIPKLLIKPSKL